MNIHLCIMVLVSHCMEIRLYRVEDRVLTKLQVCEMYQQVGFDIEMFEVTHEEVKHELPAEIEQLQSTPIYFQKKERNTNQSSLKCKETIEFKNNLLKSPILQRTISQTNQFELRLFSGYTEIENTN